MAGKLSKLARSIFSHPGVKIASLVIAIILWFIAQIYEVQERTITIPIKFTDIPTNLVISEATEYISVRASGLGKDLLGIKQGDIYLEVSLNEYEAGEHLVEVKKNAIVIPEGSSIKIEGFGGRNTIAVRIEEIEYRWVPIVVFLRGMPAEDYIISGDISKSPSFALIKGKSSLINRVDFVRTTPVDISQVTEDVHTTATVVSSLSGIVVVEPNNVNIGVGISRISR